jgi:hypothetical protein
VGHVRGRGSIGFEKLDILSQRGIGHIRKRVDIVKENRGQKIDVHRVQDFKRMKVRRQLEVG